MKFSLIPGEEKKSRIGNGAWSLPLINAIFYRKNIPGPNKEEQRGL
jgi:hypothetical protein